MTMAMKPGVSSLNPYAASYIPLSKREVSDRTYMPEKSPKSGSGTVWFSNPEQTRQNQPQSKASFYSNAHGAEKVTTADISSVKSNPAHGSSSQNMSEMTDRGDEELDMELEYLQMAFPGISYQSLSEVYLVNNSDLESSVDMLSHLESHTTESPEILPDTLDIGDVVVSSSPSDASSKMKKVASEAGASSSSSVQSAIVS